MMLALLQFAPALLDRDETLGRLDALLQACPAADLVVLPELCNSGYDFASREEAFESAERIDDSPFLDHLTKMCAALDGDIVTGLNERDGDRLYNTAVLLSPRGVEGVYRKLHLFMNEKDIFTPAPAPGTDGLPVFTRPYGTIGIQICFDWCFPETWRILALKGADIIAHPSNLVLPDRCQRAVPIHAMLNRMFIATANRVGTEGDLSFTGCSLIADPCGSVIARAEAMETAILAVEIDPTRARDKSFTPRNDAFADRRPDQYTALAATSTPPA